MSITNEFSKTEPIYIRKRIINNNSLDMFRQRLHETDWAEIETSRNPNMCYKIFWGKFCFFYDEYFPIKSIKLKTTDIQSPCIAIKIKIS